MRYCCYPVAVLGLGRFSNVDLWFCIVIGGDFLGLVRTPIQLPKVRSTRLLLDHCPQGGITVVITVINGGHRGIYTDRRQVNYDRARYASRRFDTID